MEKIKFVLLAGIILVSLSCTKKEERAIVIDGIKVSQKEFTEAFARSNYAQTPTQEARKKFLENFINRKLLLKEAEKLGLDKDPQFLDGVQKFWEQSLLKIVLDKKIKELSLDIQVNDTEVKNFYQANKDKFSNKEISEVYDQIKLILFKAKQKQALDGWINSLKKKTKIKINYKLLNLE